MAVIRGSGTTEIKVNGEGALELCEDGKESPHRRTHEYIETGKEGDGGMAIAPGGGLPLVECLALGCFMKQTHQERDMASKMPKRRQKVGKGMVPKTAFVETP
jgi:gentisate 1,2-dioxygenase